MRNQNIAARVLNQPLLLEPGYARVFLGALAPRLGIASLQDEFGLIESQEKLRMRADSFGSERPRNRPYEVLGGIAVIPVSGTLVHKFGHLQPYSGMTGYDGIIARVEEALADPTVNGILLDMDTPGGEVSGCFDTARRLNELRGEKPIASISYDMACSAGMALHSATDYRYTTTSARTGSVGVVMMHASFEEQLKANGIDVTLIHSGAFKVDGNPYENLPEQVLARFQAESDRLRNEFAEMVGVHIGLSASDVLATEAAIYTGQDAIDVGFADELINGHDMLAAFSDYIQTTTTIGVSTMTVESKTKPAATAPAPAPDASTEQPETVDTTKVATDAAAAEQARISGILQCDEAEGRSKLAQHFAFNTKMSVDEAKAALAAAEVPEQKASGPSGLLSAAMNNTKQPEIGADADTSEPEQSASDVKEIMGSYRRATGRKPVTH
ncbi:Clp protease ClpP [Marinobacter salarius]|uniref:S49 family peptidase n=1 Tax=Marinobacter salarius TaxID=1420917 RepID=UPI001253C6B3|nr:S49 family peptidase [Marinobacter salarius]VVT02799.1 Capsid protein of prophage [Marinobacter salarius]VXC24923.1 Clp protease ClpP [Marinobacter salarius]